MMMRTAPVSLSPSTADLAGALALPSTDELTPAQLLPTFPRLRRWGRFAAQLPLGILVIWGISLYDAWTNGHDADCLFAATEAARLYFIRLITDDPSVTTD